MAYDVFISWGSPDRDAVIPIAERLRQLGVSVFEYTHEMSFGDQIAERVRQAISVSKIAIVCLSQQSANREWITTEVAWIHTAKHEGRMRSVIPVQVGAIDVHKLPSLLANQGLFVGDFSDRTKFEEILEALVEKVFELLGGMKPLWLPAAIFAMGRTDFDGLVDPRPAFLNLCTYVGMVGSFVPTLRERYGADAESFMPFPGGPTAKEIVQNAVRRLNVTRKLRRLPPIHLRWISDDLGHPDGNRRRKARDRWNLRNSLMIIDSLSVFHKSTRELLTSLAAHRDQTAVVWIPPYTARTGALENLIDAATDDFDQLNDCVRHWSQPANDPKGDVDVRRGVFDVGTHAGLWHWLFLMLADLDDRGPDGVRLADVQSSYVGPATSPGNWIS